MVFGCAVYALTGAFSAVDVLGEGVCGLDSSLRSYIDTLESTKDAYGYVDPNPAPLAPANGTNSSVGPTPPQVLQDIADGLRLSLNYVESACPSHVASDVPGYTGVAHSPIIKTAL